MSHASIMNRSQMFAAAMAISAAGFLVSPTPAQADPMFPLAPLCKQYGFTGNFALKQSNGAVVKFGTNGPFTAVGQAVATGTGDGTMRGDIRGGMNGYSNVDFTIIWRGGLSVGHYTGAVADDGFVHGVSTDEVYGNSANWDSTVPLACVQPVAAPEGPKPPPETPIPPAGPAAARLGVAVQGPTTLRAGQGSAYTVILSNPGDAGAPVELYISFGGQLQQTGQVTPSGGVNCDVINNAGGTTAVHCTGQQLQSKATASIVVQGRGAAPGAGHLTATISSSDAAAQFVQKSQKLNVSIT